VRWPCLLWTVSLVVLNIFLSSGVATAQLNVNPLSVSFGSVQLGSSATQSIVVSNSGGSDVTVSQASVTGSGFNLNGPALPLTLAASQSTIFSVTFAPKSGGSAIGSLSLASSSSRLRGNWKKRTATSSLATLATVSLSGICTSPPTASSTPGDLIANPGSLSFAGIQVGNSQTQSVTLTNSGGSSVTIAQAATTGSGFSLNGMTWPLTLAVGQSITFSATFAPQSTGTVSGVISVSSDASTPTLTIPLTGTAAAAGQLAVTPASTDFGSVTIGTSKTLKGTLTASGSSVTVSSASVTSPEFSIGGIAPPLTLAPGQSMPFTLMFTPQASGSASATVSFASNAANTVAEFLTGAGTAPPQHDVSLSWNDVASVVGYNVYRGSQSGGPYAKINPVLDASAVYSDSAVQGGQTYYYVTTAVDSNGAQSGYSNEIRVAIPSP
jgi:Abnormal spindle-like microcephaly-assoc'd, ASPM-SPD-2-Hydin